MIPRSGAVCAGKCGRSEYPGAGVSALMVLVPATAAFRGVNAAPDYTRQRSGKFSLTTAATLTEGESRAHTHRGVQHASWRVTDSLGRRSVPLTCRWRSTSTPRAWADWRSPHSSAVVRRLTANSFKLDPPPFRLLYVIRYFILPLYWTELFLMSDKLKIEKSVVSVLDFYVCTLYVRERWK